MALSSKSQAPPPYARSSRAGAEVGQTSCDGDCERAGLSWQGRPVSDLWVPVTPQMLVIAIKALRLERRPITESAITDFLQERYPVREPALVRLEVARKLRCACAVGIARRAGGRFRLPRNRGTRMRLTPQEVTEFWREYVNDRPGLVRSPGCRLYAGRRVSRRLDFASFDLCSSYAPRSSPEIINLESSDDDEEMAEANGGQGDPLPAET